MTELFPRSSQCGVFRGFREGGLEFHADIALPYHSRLHNVPMHGQFLLVQLETPDEAVLGRITSLASEGRLASSSGEDYNLRTLRDERSVPEELRRDYLKYRVTIRVLGVVRSERNGIVFVPSHRRLPHVGSPVAFPSTAVLRKLVGHDVEGATLGVFALGEYIYAGSDPAIEVEDWMQVREPEIQVNFPIRNLVSRRSFVFARAGFGKSNLNKLLFSRLYEETPTVEKGGGREVPVGTLIFDPDGEYFWPDDKDRPGLCDVPALQDKIVVFTPRHPPSEFYGSFVSGGIKLDIRRLQPGDVISIALSPEKQDQQNVRKLRAMNPNDWGALVDLIDDHGNGADLELVQKLLRLERDQQAEALAARANVTSIVRMLHDKSSQLMDTLMHALADGKLCVVDVSQMRGGPSLILSGLILRRIFDRNQEEFTRAEPRTIPTIAVVEEAQSVLNERSPAATPYIEWVKEGRKYDLGAVLITQQPGSIPTEILSQGDNWFIFHLLSGADLGNVQKANAHFSKDLLSSLLNEPIAGQGLFWSSVSGTPFPIPLRVVSFESLYPLRDLNRNKSAVETYASRLREDFAMSVASTVERVVVGNADASELEGEEGSESSGVDAFRSYQQAAIAALRDNPDFVSSLERNGIPWGVVKGMLKDALPSHLDGRDELAYRLVATALDEILGERDSGWTTERRGERNTTFIVKPK